MHTLRLIAALCYTASGLLAAGAFICRDAGIKRLKGWLSDRYIAVESSAWADIVPQGAVVTDRIMSWILGSEIISARAAFVWTILISFLWLISNGVVFLVNRPADQPLSVTLDVIGKFWRVYTICGFVVDFLFLVLSRYLLRKFARGRSLPAMITLGVSGVLVYASFASFITLVSLNRSVIFVYPVHSWLVAPIDYFQEHRFPIPLAFLNLLAVLIPAAFSSLLLWLVCLLLIVASVVKNAFAFVVERTDGEQLGVFVFAGGFAGIAIIAQAWANFLAALAAPQ